MSPLSLGDAVARHPWRALVVFVALCVLQAATGVFDAV